MTDKKVEAPPPKLFISYSWTTPEHEEWVLNLATELCDSGVHVILDKWHLKEGHDSYKFMEKMVTDPEIKKVIMVTDKAYAEKADGRSGGVGTETQIISKEVYEDQSQDKFVAVIPNKDENGNAHVPTYYKSRIHIDLSDDDLYVKNFETLLRWIFDKPLYIMPEIGKPPEFLNESTAISLGTSAVFKRLIDALKNDKSYKYGTLNEYLDTFSRNLEKFRIQEYEGEYDDALLENIKSFLPHRNEFIQLLSVICQYSAQPESVQQLYKFFESLIPYLSKPESVNSWRESDFDNFRFIVHELFLYTIAAFIKNEHFNLISQFLDEKFYVKDTAGIATYSEFRIHLESLERRKKRLGLNRLSLVADILKDRCSGTGIDFTSLMQADFVVYIRSINQHHYWWPDTLVFAERFSGPFEIFSRASSKKYFEKIKPLIGVNSVSELAENLNSERKSSGSFSYGRGIFFRPEVLLGIDHLDQII